MPPRTPGQVVLQIGKPGQVGAASDEKEGRESGREEVERPLLPRYTHHSAREESDTLLFSAFL